VLVDCDNLQNKKDSYVSKVVKKSRYESQHSFKFIDNPDDIYKFSACGKTKINVGYNKIIYVVVKTKRYILKILSLLITTYFNYS